MCNNIVSKKQSMCLNLKNTLLLQNASHHLNLQCVIIFLLAEGLDLMLVAAG